MCTTQHLINSRDSNILYPFSYMTHRTPDLSNTGFGKTSNGDLLIKLIGAYSSRIRNISRRILTIVRYRK